MDRRQVLVTGGLTSAAFVMATLPTPIALAAPSVPPPGDQRIIWQDKAIAHPHADVAKAWIEEQIASGWLTVTATDLVRMNYDIKLTNPRFMVKSDCRVWSVLKGETTEPGLSVHVSECGVPVGKSSLATMLETVDGRVVNRHANLYPDYMMRTPYLSDDEFAAIERELPANHIEWSLKV